MMIQSASYISIALTILMVNLRYSLFTSTLAPLVSRKSSLYTTLFSYGTTDETFALNLSSFRMKKSTGPTKKPWGWICSVCSSGP